LSLPRVLESKRTLVVRHRRLRSEMYGLNTRPNIHCPRLTSHPLPTGSGRVPKPVGDLSTSVWSRPIRWRQQFTDTFWAGIRIPSEHADLTEEPDLVVEEVFLYDLAVLPSGDGAELQLEGLSARVVHCAL